MRALLARRRKGDGERRDIAVAAGQGNENLANHLPLPALTPMPHPRGPQPEYRAASLARNAAN